MTRYDPPIGQAAARRAGILFVALLSATAWLLWHAHLLGTLTLAVGAAAVVAGLWWVGRICSPRLTETAGNPSER